MASNRVRARLTVIGAFACLVGLAACSHVNHLRDAQESFSRAADTDNRSATAARDNLQRGSKTVANEPAPAGAGYTAALFSLDQLEEDRDSVTRLKNDGLYGNALALRAMANWRLQRYAKAKEAAQQALKSGLVKGSRDYALMTALPGLVANDEAHSEIVASAGGTNLDGARAKLNTADAELCAADQSVDANHPVRVYLALSALGALRNVVYACEKQYGTSDPLKSGECFDGDGLKREQRTRAYFNRLEKELGVDQKELVVFATGIPMSANAAEHCPRPK